MTTTPQPDKPSDSKRVAADATRVAADASGVAADAAGVASDAANVAAGSGKSEASPQQPDTFNGNADRKNADAVIAAAMVVKDDKEAAAAVVSDDKKAAAAVLARKDKYDFLKNTISLLLLAIGPLLTAMVLYYQSQTHKLVNSMSDKLLEATAKVSHAEGVEEGKASKDAK